MGTISAAAAAVVVSMVVVVAVGVKHVGRRVVGRLAKMLAGDEAVPGRRVGKEEKDL